MKRAVSCAVVQGSVGEVGKAEGVEGRERALRLRMCRCVESLVMERSMEGAGEAAVVVAVRARFLGGMVGA